MESYLIWIILFLLLFFSSFYVISRAKSWTWHVIFLFISFIQGIVIAFVLESSNLYLLFEKSFTFLPVSVMCGVVYFPLCQMIVNAYNVKLKGGLKNIEEFKNSDVKNRIVKIWNLKNENLLIDIYDDGDNPNAQRELSINKIKIHLGRKFLNLVNDDQLLFVLSHEIAHTTRNVFVLHFTIFCLVYMIFILYMSQLVQIITGISIILVFPIIFVFFLIGLMGVNLIQWKEEYYADLIGCQKLKDITRAELFFQTEHFFQKDHGLFIDLIFNNHPSTKRRRKNIQKLKFE
jgi:Zn-dependent protease with chaperone function